MPFWSPDDAIKGIDTPFQYKYIKYLRSALQIVSLWPKKELGVKAVFSKIFAVYILIIQMLCLLFIIGYMIKNSEEQSFLEKGHLYITAFMNTLSFSRVILLMFNQKYKNLLSRFIEEMHLFHHSNYSDYAMKIHMRVHLFCHWYTLYLLGLLTFGMVLFNAITLYSNYAKGKLHKPYLYNTTYEQAVYYLYPAESATRRSTYIYINIFNWYISTVCCIIVLMVDLCVFLIGFHIWGHFKIVLNDLYTFPRPAEESHAKGAYDGAMFTSSELKDVSERLKRCINYHRFSIACTRDVSDTFGPLLFVYYIFQQVSCCLLLLECSQLTIEALVQYGPLTFVIYQQLIHLSLIFEMIGTASENLKHAVYSIPWECMDVPNRRTCVIFLMASQRAMTVKALGLAPIGVTTMASIIKTSLTYFTFLRTIAE